MRSGRSSKLITVSVVGWLILSFPILSIVSHPVCVSGIPVLFFYVFAVWLAIIFATFMLSKTGPGK